MKPEPEKIMPDPPLPRVSVFYSFARLTYSKRQFGLYEQFLNICHKT
jgi:hypothetical protein